VAVAVIISLEAQTFQPHLFVRERRSRQFDPQEKNNVSRLLT
jgi:hypothetical protein